MLRKNIHIQCNTGFVIICMKNILFDSKGVTSYVPCNSNLPETSHTVTIQ